MATTNQEIGRRWFEEVWNKQRREAIGEMMASDAVLNEGGTATAGADAFERYFDQMQSMFSEIRASVDDVIGDGDTVAVRWSCTMRHTGDALGIVATNRSVQTTGITIFRIVDGKIVEGWQNWDMIGVMQTIGADPSRENSFAMAAYSST